jgi:hypothetical protein
MSLPLPAELSLAAACCRWPFQPESEEVVRNAARGVRDWERFDRVVRRNRISPLAHHALARAGVDFPTAIERELARRARAAASKALAMARESLLLQREFERAGLPVMIVKGAPLSLLAYGRLGMKESWDIDLLTTQDSALVAARLLVERGYCSAIGHLEPRQVDAYVRFDKEAEFRHPVSNLTVELHWRLVDHCSLLRGVDANGPAQGVASAAGTFRTLADEALFAYLCLHGTAHNWSRLKWLADLGAWLAGRSDAELTQFLATARNYGAGRAASLGLKLCRGLLGRQFSTDLLESLEHGRMIRALERGVLAGLSYRAGAGEHRQYTPPWLRATAARFFVAPGAAHAFEHARLLWNNPVDLVEARLPDRLAFLYPVLRIPFWLVRSSKRIALRFFAASPDKPVTKRSSTGLPPL